MSCARGRRSLRTFVRRAIRMAQDGGCTGGGCSEAAPPGWRCGVMPSGIEETTGVVATCSRRGSRFEAKRSGATARSAGSMRRLHGPSRVRPGRRVTFWARGVASSREPYVLLQPTAHRGDSRYGTNIPASASSRNGVTRFRFRWRRRYCAPGALDEDNVCNARWRRGQRVDVVVNAVARKVVRIRGAGARSAAAWRDCPNVPNLGGGPYDVQVQRVSCRTARRLSTAECHYRDTCPRFLGFRCSTRVTGRESSATICRKRGRRRVRWTNGA